MKVLKVVGILLEFACHAVIDILTIVSGLVTAVLAVILTAVGLFGVLLWSIPALIVLFALYLFL